MEIDFCPINPSHKCTCGNGEEARRLIELSISFFVEKRGKTRDEAIAIIKERADSVFRAMYVFPSLAKGCQFSNIAHV